MARVEKESVRGIAFPAGPCGGQCALIFGVCADESKKTGSGGDRSLQRGEGI